MATLAILSVLAIVYAYFGYPLLLQAFSSRRAPGAVGAVAARPKIVSIIVAARNEEQHIEEKLRSTLNLISPADVRLEILVASDCSEDRTDEIVRAFPEIKLVRSAERLGKEHAQALAVTESSGEVIIFTDAKVRLEPEAISQFLEAFSDPSVGAVSSLDVVEKVEGGGSGEGMYVRYEMWLRDLETKFGSLVGLSGSCFAVRRAVAEGLRNDIPSDFALLLRAQQLGLRGISTDSVKAYYREVKSEEAEFVRKVRTVLRGMTTVLAVRRELWSGISPVFAWQLISHKIMRWLVPFFMVSGTFSALIGGSESLLALLIADAFLLLYVLSFMGFVWPNLRSHRAVKVALFFMIANSAIAVAWIKLWRGDRFTLWNPSAKQ